MRRLFNLVLILFINMFALAVSAQETADTIKQMLIERDREIKNVLGPEGSDYTDDQREQLKAMINNIIDFEAMSKEALAETYNEITDEQRTEFVDLFTAIISDNSLNKLDIYRARVTYNEVEVNGNDVLVKTMAELDDVRTPVDYKFHLKDGEWLITDMSIDDVYTAVSYNRQFERIIRRRGFDALMDSLRKRAARS